MNAAAKCLGTLKGGGGVSVLDEVHRFYIKTRQINKMYVKKDTLAQTLE